MDVEEVGKFRFCPACGRPVVRKGHFYDLDTNDTGMIDVEEIICSCCNRPWIACPCTPATEGECRSTVKSK